MTRPHSIFATGVIAALAILPLLASAQLTPGSTGLSKAAEGTGLVTSCSGTNCLVTIVGNVINLALSFIGVILLALILYGGFLWMTSGGDTKGVERAQIMIRNAVAGAIIVAISYAITAFVLGQLATIAGSSTGGAGSSSISCTSQDDCRSLDVSCPTTPPTTGLALCSGGTCTPGSCR